mmetsp:Transcript_8910/g.11803  ORF Transcript_8910/g.11803 Transcript_8910/m.11803 type:complete len:492 (+) Transcript_8910:106-1581(+)
MEGIDLLGHIDRLKESFLWAAAKGGRTEECQSLIQLGADVNWVSPEGDTALLAAVRNGHSDVTSFLLAHGSNINYSMQGTGESALHVACKRGQQELAQMLVEAGASLSREDGRGQTPLVVAQTHGHQALAHRLQTLSQRIERRRMQDQFRESASSPHTGNPNNQANVVGGGGPLSRLPAIRGENRASATQTQVQQAMAALEVYGQTGDPARAAGVASAYEPSSDEGSGSEDHPSVEDSSALEEFDLDEEDTLSEAGSLPPEEARSIGALEAQQLSIERSHGSQSSVRRRPQQRGSNSSLSLRRPQLAGGRELHHSHSTEDFQLISETQNLDLTGQVAMLRRELKKAIQERDVAQAKAEAVKEQSSKMWNELMAAEQTVRRLRKERDDHAQKLARLQGKQLASMTLSAVETLEEDLRKLLEETTKYKEKLIREKLDTRSEQNLCVICQEEEKCVLILPCRHLCLCRQCSNAPQLKMCPLCRKEIQQTLHVFS